MLDIRMVGDVRAQKLNEVAVARAAEAVEALGALTSSIGDTEQEVAVDNHAVGSYLTMNGTLWRVISGIAKGERVREGVNVVATTVATELMAVRDGAV